MPILSRYRRPLYVKDRHANYMRYYMQERANRLKDEGLCVICGLHPPRDEKVTCWRCADTQRRKYRDRTKSTVC